MIVVHEKTASGCMAALGVLMLLRAMTEERDPAIDLEAVDQELESSGPLE